jgi:hypothetical protein
MEMINLYCWGGIGALLCLIVGAMLGYARCESQQLLGNSLQREHLHACDAKWRELLKDAEDNAREHHCKWAYADKYRHALVEVMTDTGVWDFAKHGDDPAKMLKMLVEQAVDFAINPAFNKKAKNLYVRGVRAGAKKGRAQMQKFMQKSIDNQAATIRHYDSELTNANVRRMRFTEAVTNVMNDKIALPSVRRAFNQAIIQEHDRLRAVAAKKVA